jgi:hypothetical protein
MPLFVRHITTTHLVEHGRKDIGEQPQLADRPGRQGERSAPDCGEDFDWRALSGLSFRLRGSAVINCMGMTSRFRAGRTVLASSPSS